jgi:MFS family permease
VVLGLVLSKFLIEPERGASEFTAGRSAKRIPLAGFLRILWNTPTALILMATFVCPNFVAAVLLSWMPAFLYDKFHLSLAAAGLTATIFVQLASTAGSPLGGWLADILRRRTPGGRMMVQAVGVLGGAPFVVLWGLTTSVGWLIVALIAWGFFKGLYDANIFASVFDVIRPEARGTAAGFMNMVGWLGGGGTAPIVIGYIAQRASLGLGIAMAAAVYVAAGALLIAGIAGFVRRDAARMQAQLAAKDTFRGLSKPHTGQSRLQPKLVVSSLWRLLRGAVLPGSGNAHSKRCSNAEGSAPAYPPGPAGPAAAARHRVQTHRGGLCGPGAFGRRAPFFARPGGLARAAPSRPPIGPLPAGSRPRLHLADGCADLPV